MGTTLGDRASRMLMAGGLAIAVTVGSASAAAAAPGPADKDRDRRSTIDDLAPYQPQRTCHPTPKAGVVAFRARVLRAHPSTFDYGIGRACGIGGTSEHKEGRAWDWGVRDKDVAKKFLKSFLAREGRRKKYADARRFGVMYIIYDKEIWRSYEAKRGWEPYDCSGVRNCHEDHVHFSFSWEGAEKRTSGWDGTPVRYKD